MAGERGICCRVGRAEPARSAWTLAEADYDWLLAHAACVIHHGGVGTLAAVLRAGKPSILLPQILSQAQFGNMLMREKLAAGVFEASRIESGELAAAIRRAVSDDEMIASALRWQAAVRAEGGVHAAADLINSMRNTSRSQVQAAAHASFNANDHDSQRYIDLFSAHGAAWLGHCHPGITAEVAASSIVWLAGGLDEALAQARARVEDFPGCVWLAALYSTGMGGEFALRLARVATGRTR